MIRSDFLTCRLERTWFVRTPNGRLMSVGSDADAERIAQSLCDALNVTFMPCPKCGETKTELQEDGK